ncbi:MAG TPA: pyruvate kinase [Longimicrobiales bacterium]|nr:pyruvate kinase [Longimicrobiales bacterium]
MALSVHRDAGMETPPTTRRDAALSPRVLDRLALDLQELRHEVLEGEAALADVLDAVHPENRPSARNLVHYLSLRRHDIRALQLRLARVGLSSLGRLEPHVLITLDRTLAMLALARGGEPPEFERPPISFGEGNRILAGNTRRLLGVRPRQRAVHIVVTLPTEAATNPQLVHDLLVAGMTCARVNCAHDDAAAWTAMAENVRAAANALGRECRLLVDLGGPKLRTGAVAGDADRLVLTVDDCFELVASDGVPMRDTARPRIACSTPEIFRYVQPGEPIWFNDGRIGGVIEERIDDGIIVRVTHAKKGGSKLRPERGINLPETDLTLPALTEKDVRDLATVIPWADAIELSFVQSTEDVEALHAALSEHGADHIGVILKIEKRRAFADLPLLLLAAMQRRSCAVMIARGDLAVEAGFERMVEVQEEILWIAEAAHVPTIWATEVLDELAKEGTLSRAEVTDAAMAARAEAVMLNKGPFVIAAIATLDNIIDRMQDHLSKKRSLFRALSVTRSLWK